MSHQDHGCCRHSLVIGCVLATFVATASAQGLHSSDIYLNRLLDRYVSFGSQTTTLDSALRDLQRATGLRIRTDRLESTIPGIGLQSTVRYTAGRRRMRAWLTELVQQSGYRWTAAGRQVWVVSESEFWSRLVTRTYHLPTLCRSRGISPVPDVASMVATITTQIEPRSWGRNGGKASIHASGATLVVSHSWQTHQQLDAKLDGLMRARRPAQDADSWDRAFLPQVNSTQPTHRWSFTSLREAIQAIDQRTENSVILDSKAIEKESLKQGPLPIFYGKVSWRTALSQIVRELQLGEVIIDDKIVITSPVAAEEVYFWKKFDLSRMVGVGKRFEDDYYDWMDLVETVLDPDSWDSVGGVGEVKASVSAGKLAVKHSRQMHRKVESIIQNYQLLKDLQEGESPRLPTSIPILTHPNDAVIDQRLRQTISTPVNSMSLEKLAKILDESLGVPVCLMRLNDYGVSKDSDIKWDVRSLTAARALDLLTRQLSLTWTISDGVVIISDEEAVEDVFLQTRLYPVGDFDGSTIQDVVTNIEQDMWDEYGGIGATHLSKDGKVLFVSQILPIHKRLSQFFKQLRRAKSGGPSQLPTSLSVINETQSPQFKDRLNQSVTIHHSQVALNAIFADLQRRTGVKFVVDHRALDDIGVSLDTQYDADLPPLPLRSAVYHLTRRFELAVKIQEDSLLITSEEEMEAQQEARVYPAADLLRFYDGQVTPENADFDTLIEFTTLFNDVDSWDEVGGAGQISAVPTPLSFVIQQTTPRLRKIDHFFEALRRQQQQRARGKLKVSDWTIVGSDRERELFRLMRLPNPRVFQAWPAQMTIRDLTKRIRNELKLPFVVETLALEDTGLDEGHTLKLPEQRRTLGQILSAFPKELGWTVDHDAVVVREVDEAYLVGIFPLDEVGPLTVTFGDDIVEKIDAGGWSDEGGMGELQYDDRSLIVLQRPAYLDQVADYVRRYRRARPVGNNARVQRTKTPKQPASAYRQGTFF